MQLGKVEGRKMNGYTNKERKGNDNRKRKESKPESYVDFSRDPTAKTR